MNKNIKSINLNELPRYSKWAKNLLELKKINFKRKNEKEINREFDIEKWGKILNHFSTKKKFSLDDVINQEFKYDTVIPCFDYINGFHLTKFKHNFDSHITIYKKILNKHIVGASSLIN